MELCPNIAPKQIMENLENDKDIKEVPLFRDLYNFLARYKINYIGDEEGSEIRTIIIYNNNTYNNNTYINNTYNRIEQ